MKHKTILLLFIIVSGFAQAQTKRLSLEEAVKLGIENSKQLKLSQTKIGDAAAHAEQVADNGIPEMKVTAGYSHALMLTRSLILPSSNGSPKETKLPFDNSLYQAGISVDEQILDNHRFRYAKESAALLVNISKLDAEKDKDEIIYNIIRAYINYYKIRRNQQIVAQDLQDIESKLEEIRKFEQQGLAIRNDVLNFELQQSNIQLVADELENNRQIANYSMNLLLGLPDSTDLDVQEVSFRLNAASTFDDYLQQALTNRKEFRDLHYQDQQADINIKKISDEKLPTLGVSGNLYYFNLSKNIVPKSGTYLAPFLIGINAGWDITSLLRNKNKLNEARIKKQEVSGTRDILNDKVKEEVNKSFRQYQLALDKIRILQTAVAKASENERTTEARFHNNLATTTERIDAQTMVFQSRINLELARADATNAYYSLLYATGQINQYNQ